MSYSFLGAPGAIYQTRDGVYSADSNGIVTVPKITGNNINDLIGGGLIPFAVNLNTGSYSFTLYSPSSANTMADLTSALQNFLLYCQLQFLKISRTNLTDQVQRSWVNAYIAAEYMTITSPLIIPEYVNAIFDGIIVRNGQSGAVTNFYTGDTTSKSLANRVQPALMVPPRGHVQKASIYCNSNGTDNGSGIIIGKNWTMYTPAIASGGTGYAVNDVLVFAQPSLSPYIAATVTVTSVSGSGVITGVTITNAGAYALPPVLQKQQWTAANGFPGIFDANGNLTVTGGTGSGASLAPNWVSDWGTNGAGGGSTYYGGAGGIITDTLIGDVLATQCGNYTDGTYGGVFGTYFHSLNHIVHSVETVFGAKGISIVNCSDMRIDSLNPVDAGLAMLVLSAASIECKKVVIDTPTGNNTCFSIDNSTTIDFEGEIFKRNIQNLGSTAPATISLGLFSTGSQTNINIKLDFNIRGGGAGGDASHISSIGCPVLYIANTLSFNINLNITNIEPSYGGQYGVITQIASFGSGIGSGRISGSIDHAFGALYSGTLPTTVALDIFDAEIALVTGTVTATIGGSATAGDVISLTFTNSYFVHTYTWPRTVSYTVTGGQTTTQIAAGITAAINADAVLLLTGVIATNAANVITIGQMGQLANSTVLSSLVSGSATETVTFTNSGQISGAVSGGKLITGGIYDLAYAGLPVNGSMGSGWGKAGPGSVYTNLITGNKYINNNTAASPFWKPVSGFQVIAQAYPDAFHTGTGETSLASVKIPGGMLSANGALRITAQWAYPNNANNKTMVIRHSTTSGDTSAGVIYYNNTETTKASSRYQIQIQNSNSVSSQTGGINNGTYYDSSGSAVVGNINTANDSWINFNINNANASDNSGLLQYTIEWLEP